MSAENDALDGFCHHCQREHAYPTIPSRDETPFLWYRIRTGEEQYCRFCQDHHKPPVLDLSADRPFPWDFPTVLKMMQHTQLDPDTEVAHVTADDLLLHAFSAAASGWLLSQAQVIEFENAYGAVDKWFA